ncbi:MAG: hypothetical protein KBD78_13020 [Oligoflexales bacterium]|nr:hypothetical protein [Oligoflexales bacterium]
MKFFVGFYLFLFFSACKQIPSIKEDLSNRFFQSNGRPLFKSAEKVPIKQVHLDLALIQGREIVVEGTIDRVSEFRSYLVLADDSGKLIVNLVNIYHLPEEILLGQKVRVKGTIAYGKKGTPLLEAAALNFNAG